MLPVEETFLSSDLIILHHAKLRKANSLELSESVRSIRKRLGLTLNDLAQKLGTQASTISRYEKGKIVPSRSMLLLLLSLAATTDEKQPIEAALTGSTPDKDLLRDIGKLQSFFDKVAKEGSRSRERHELFGGLAMMIAGREEIEQDLVDVLRFYIRHSGNPDFGARLRASVLLFRKWAASQGDGVFDNLLEAELQLLLGQISQFGTNVQPKTSKGTSGFKAHRIL